MMYQGRVEELEEKSDIELLVRGDVIRIGTVPILAVVYANGGGIIELVMQDELSCVSHWKIDKRWADVAEGRLNIENNPPDVRYFFKCNMPDEYQSRRKVIEMAGCVPN